MFMGRFTTRVLHSFDQTSFNWFFKKRTSAELLLSNLLSFPENGLTVLEIIACFSHFTSTTHPFPTVQHCHVERKSPWMLIQASFCLSTNDLPCAYLNPPPHVDVHTIAHSVLPFFSMEGSDKISTSLDRKCRDPHLGSVEILLRSNAEQRRAPQRFTPEVHEGTLEVHRRTNPTFGEVCLHHPAKQCRSPLRCTLEVHSSPRGAQLINLCQSSASRSFGCAEQPNAVGSILRRQHIMRLCVVQCRALHSSAEHTRGECIHALEVHSSHQGASNTLKVRGTEPRPCSLLIGSLTAFVTTTAEVRDRPIESLVTQSSPTSRRALETCIERTIFMMM